jgi:GNAT superfamily N-acetyltransferase
MGISVEPLALPLADEVVDALVDLRRASDAVANPDDPPVGAGELLPDLFFDRPLERRSVWLARRDGRPVGFGVGGVDVEGENVGYAEVEIDVHPTHEGSGIEAAVVAASLPWFEELGARSIAWWPTDDGGRAAAESLGLTFRQLERCSRLQVGDVDDAQQAAWSDAERARAAGYEIVTWRGSCPDHLLDAYATAYSAMADAPLDDIDWTPHAVTSDEVRRREDGAARRGRSIFAGLVVDAGGAAAGMTRIDVHADRPQLGHQEDTAVVPGHRGFAIGRWLKAANLRQVRDAVPELAVVETYNAESNPWMLAINVDMGFRPHRAFHAYQADLTTVAAAVGRRG